ncbi:TonB-dependent siderophore receptor [Flavobacterium marginilacus]|uniref:TonB-dependent siderophore receptor n=1 Tax=Flavobacterium marginilacus TaxID=3003256 RepID=UPI00248EE0A3|nr:TonB-dependent siderophore receptor [Flavobacterium marginilacus]
MKNVILISTIMLFSIAGYSQQTAKDSISKLNEVHITNKYKYKREKSTTVSKMPLKDIENPQVYNTVTSELLKEQVVTNLNDALKNATGITRLWESTGRGTDGAEYFSMRGFAVQPTMTNGLPAVTNATVDPINVDNIEVMKGPSGTLYGSSLISYGGLINIVTKKPYDFFGGEISYTSGTYGLDRVTTDINAPLGQGFSVRLNAAYQNENSFQDAGFSKSFFFAPSLSYKVNDKLSFLVNTEFSSRNSANAPMVFLNRYVPLSFHSMDLFEQNYKKSYTSNDLTISNPSFNMQTQMFYKISDQWTSQTALSRSTTKSEGYGSYLWDGGDGDHFGRFVNEANSQTNTTDIQQNFIGDFKIGSLRNRIVVGLDYFGSKIQSGGSGWLANGVVSLKDQTDTGDLTQGGIDGILKGSFQGNSTAETQVLSAYASDVLNVTDRLSAMVSLRIDNFKSITGDESNDQTALSPKLGIVYQVIEDKVSLFGNYMNGFTNVLPKQITIGSETSVRSFDPEHANQFEFGLKTNLYKDIISATISYYDIDVKDKVITDPVTFTNFIQGGAVYSRGFEVSLTANPTKGLNLIAGFSNNKSEMTNEVFEGSGYLDMRPEEAGPETLINFWANYAFPEGSLKGFALGFGGNYASEYATLNRSNIGTFELPSYTILNSVLSYNTSKFGISLKANNLLNEKYYSGWSTITPQRLRSVYAGLTYKF